MKKILFFLLALGSMVLDPVSVNAQHSRFGYYASSIQSAPPAVFSTLNPTGGGTTLYAWTLYGSDLSAVHRSGFGNGSATSTGFITVGSGHTALRRFQVTWNHVTGAQSFGFFDPTANDVLQIPGLENKTCGMWSSGDYVYASSFTGPGASYTDGDITDCVVDEATGIVSFYKGGTLQPATSITLAAGNYYAIIGGQDNEPPLSDFTVNFGGSAWANVIVGTVGF